jgi:rubrerythrin
MAVFKCEKCGAMKEGRCKPKKCPTCAEAGTMQKQEEKKSSGCGCACSSKK